MKRRVKRHAVVQPLDTSYRLIPLTQGQNAIVDVEDFEWLSQWDWYALWHPRTKSFYARRNDRSTGKHLNIKMHRAIMGFPEDDVDHKSKNTLDNRKGNLRRCTIVENNRNRRKRRDNTSGYKGVHFRKDTRKYVAYINISGERQGLGLFSDPKDAARAYDEAAKSIHGSFACLNFEQR